MAPRPHRLLIAHDGSPCADAAMRAAARLFAGSRASVVTVPADPDPPVETVLPGVSPGVDPHVIGQLRAAAQRQADETAEQAAARARALGLDAEPASVAPSARAWSAVLDAAHRLGADVLVCGTRGRGALARAVLGSTSSNLLDHANLPLLVVPDVDVALDGPFIAAYDGSDAAGRAIHAVGRLLPGRPTIVVHAWHPAGRRDLAARALAAGADADDLSAAVDQLDLELAARAAATTDEGVAAARAAGLDPAGDTVESDENAWRAVASAAQAHGGSLIAIGTRGDGTTRSVLLGSVSSGLLKNAELPMLVVPPERRPAQGA